MSNFNCERCGTAILEGTDGRYITECEHYPFDHLEADPCERVKSFGQFEYSLLVDDGVIPEGSARQCPNCGLWSRHKFPKRSGRNTCMEVACPSCGNTFEIAKGIK